MTSETPEPHPWRKWQDWAVVLLGALLLVAGPEINPGGGSNLAVVVLSSLLALSGVYSLGAPELRTEYAHVVLGLLLLASPWALDFSDQGGAWWCWIPGFLVVLLGLSSLPAADAAEPARGVAELTEVTGGGGRHHRPDPDARITGARPSSTRRPLSDED